MRLAGRVEKGIIRETLRPDFGDAARAPRGVDHAQLSEIEEERECLEPREPFLPFTGEWLGDLIERRLVLRRVFRVVRPQRLPVPVERMILKGKIELQEGTE
jgi:hypothetical protein